jgi:cytochrome b subunit of formate dehydrogenase
MGFLVWLESTAYAEWILYGTHGWPIMLTAHAFGLAIAVGVVFVMAARLLGLFEQIPVVAVRDILNFAWVGIAINIVSGISLFMSQASYYSQSIPFLVKISAIILGIINLHYVQRVLKNNASTWDSQGVPSNGKMLAWTSVILWSIAVITGRLIAYL